MCSDLYRFVAAIMCWISFIPPPGVKLQFSASTKGWNNVVFSLCFLEMPQLLSPSYRGSCWFACWVLLHWFIKRGHSSNYLLLINQHKMTFQLQCACRRRYIFCMNAIMLILQILLFILHSNIPAQRGEVIFRQLLRTLRTRLRLIFEEGNKEK